MLAKILITDRTAQRLPKIEPRHGFREAGLAHHFRFVPGHTELNYEVVHLVAVRLIVSDLAGR
jgi:hypothetical protein